MTRKNLALVDEPLRRSEGGVHLGARAIYTDPELFELEMKHLFEGDWVYAAHVSQLPKVNDYFTVTIGRQPVLLTRTAGGEIRGFLNACAHRGARVCRQKVGNRRLHTCPFHGWTYDGRGRLVGVTSEQEGGYPAGFQRSSLGLTPVAQIDIYRGFVFVALRATGTSLREYLGGAALFIDLVVDQSPTGELEVLAGETTYTTAANWKLVAENGLDGYHVGTVHASYLLVTKKRVREGEEATRNLDVSTWGQGESGFFAFENGHGLLYSPYPNHPDRPAFATYDRYVRDLGSERADWIAKKTRNLLLMPNVFLMDQMSSQIRIVRPVEVGLTEVTSYGIAPVGEEPAMRERRIRQYEDFFNATGMATPDDLTEFRNCQLGFRASGAAWNELSRGQTRWLVGTNEAGRRLGVEALASSTHAADEGVYVTILEQWKERMDRAMASESEP